jgi:hypothetical protein
MSDYAELHGLDRLRAADPDAFAAALKQTATAGALMPRPGDKESGPAPVFRPQA